MLDPTVGGEVRSGPTPVRWGSFIAMGDSFTEGLDDLLPDGSYRGWADLVAAELAARRPGFRYANLAVRGRLLSQIVTEQVPRARALRPDLVSLVGGVNDLLRPTFDAAVLHRRLERAVTQLRSDGIDVVLVVGVNPTGRSNLLTRLMPRILELNAAVADVAQRHGCYPVDLFDVAVFGDPRLWSTDRLHLSAAGHERVAAAFLQALGLGDDRWRDPLPPADATAWWDARRDDADWMRTHLLPWLGRRARGESSGAQVNAKHADLLPVLEA